MRNLSLVAAAFFAAASPALADNVYQFAAHSGQHRTFAATMQATGIDRALSNPGPYTIFAPTDSAFASHDLATLMRPDHREELVELLTCHMAPTEAVTAALATGQAQVIRTVGGCTLTLQRNANGLALRDQNGRIHKITAADLRQSNGVVHVVDSVIAPAT